MKKSVQSAKRRINAIISESSFLIYLRRIETEEARLFESCGFGSFDQFLKLNDLCDVARFENFKRGLELVGEQEAERLGANPVIALAHIRDRGKVPEFVHVVDAFTEAHGGVRPSLQVSHRLLRQVDPRPEVPRDVGHRNA